MKNAPNKWNLKNLLEHCENGPKSEIDGKWLPARPLGYLSFCRRFKYAWKVFTGEYDALEWPQE